MNRLRDILQKISNQLGHYYLHPMEPSHNLPDIPNIRIHLLAAAPAMFSAPTKSTPIVALALRASVVDVDLSG